MGSLKTDEYAEDWRLTICPRCGCAEFLEYQTVVTVRRVSYECDVYSYDELLHFNVLEDTKLIGLRQSFEKWLETGEPIFSADSIECHVRCASCGLGIDPDACPRRGRDARPRLSVIRTFDQLQLFA